ncbi:DNA adenine methylase [Thiospirillum jenense]|uniref:DNA adenine methylase n=1 Tax=Thiospirillum jenense TaxID=1653858 RepID=UPI003B8305DB
MGNKRALLPLIGQAIAQVKHCLNKNRLSYLDLFSGSGIVARYMKQHPSYLIANVLE